MTYDDWKARQADPHEDCSLCARCGRCIDCEDCECGCEFCDGTGVVDYLVAGSPSATKPDACHVCGGTGE